MLFKTIEHISTASQPYRHAFGQLRGILLWWHTRQDYKLPKGDLYALAVPGLSAALWLRAGTSDLMVFQQIFCERETDFDLSLPEPAFIVDAGANVGMSSIVFATRWPNAQVVALEVDTENFEVLCRNAKAYPGIHPVKKALWGSDGHVKIVNPSADPWAFQVVESHEGEAGAIEAISVNGLLALFGRESVSFLKLDIEGAELDVLRSKDLSWVDKTRVIAIELHDRFRPGCSEAFDQMLASRRCEQWSKGEYRVAQFS